MLQMPFKNVGGGGFQIYDWFAQLDLICVWTRSRQLTFL